MFKLDWKSEITGLSKPIDLPAFPEVKQKRNITFEANIIRSCSQRTQMLNSIYSQQVFGREKCYSTEIRMVIYEKDRKVQLKPPIKRRQILY